MGYQALLFCPDDKTARTVTQVLSELEFTVEACIEPFAAVKKLMGEHFDAVVVDCDNEQNATLLFKSARNSTSNQTSLAVAVVEGQAGVAKAFRIGANLVLTKPINIEQAKGTLRVARGLLRKADPAKPGATAAAPTPTAAPATPAAPVKPAPRPLAAKPVAPAPSAAAPVPARPAAPKPIPIPKPAVSAPAWPAAAASTPAPAAQASDPIEKTAAKIAAPAPEPIIPKPEVAAPKVERAPEVKVPAASHAPTSTMSFGTGAASAPAPAREPQIAKAPEPPVQHTVEAPAKHVEPTAAEHTSIVGAAPTFSYGSSAEAETRGGSKKIFIGVAAAVVIAVAAYFGWAQYKGHSAETAATTAPTTQSAPANPQPTKPAATQPAAVTSAPTAVEPATTNIATEESEAAPKQPASQPTPKNSKTSTASAASAPSKKVVAEDEEEATPEPAPMMVKGGKVPVQPKPQAAEVSAPSMIGMATSADAPPPVPVPSTTSELKPKLQMMSVSQGVSQGLLFKKVAPVYPSGALRLRIEGTVELVATISKNGDITQVKVVSGDSQLSKAAVDAVKQWKYKPYLLNGEPVEIQTQVSIRFKLPS
jgi:protein TonB